MATINEIITNAKGHLREIAGDAVAILKKGNDRVVDKMEEIYQKKSREYINKANEHKSSQQAILSQIKDVETAIKNQKEVESISINNPEAITGDLKAGLEGIINTLKEELKNFDKNIVVKNDFSNFASLFKSSQDKKSVIDALKKIEDKLGKKEDKEEVDYTLILDDIAKALEVKEELLPTLKAMLEKELSVTVPSIMDVNLNPSLIDNNRVRVILRDDQVANITSSSNTVPVVNTMKDGSQKNKIVDSGDPNEEVDVVTNVDDNTNLDGTSGLVANSVQYYRINETEVKPARMDASTHSIQTLTYEHHEIHAGSHFFTGNFVTLTNGQVYDILWTTPATLKYSHMIFTIATQAEAMFGYYEGVTATSNGTALSMFNRNRVIATAPGTTFYHTPTVTDTGTLIGRGIFGAGNKAGGETRDSQEFVLKPNTKYMMRVTNNTALANWYDWQFDWYEHQDKD